MLTEADLGKRDRIQKLAASEAADPDACAYMRTIAEKATFAEWFMYSDPDHKNVAHVYCGTNVSFTLARRGAFEDGLYITRFNPPTVIALLDALEAERKQRIRAEQERDGYLEQHHRDSETLRRYAAERDEMRDQRDAAKKANAHNVAMFEEVAVQLETAKGLLRKLTERLTFVHNDPAYQSVWTLSHIHNGPYKGPQYAAEYEAALAFLNPRQLGEVSEYSVAQGRALADEQRRAEALSRQLADCQRERDSLASDNNDAHAENIALSRQVERLREQLQRIKEVTGTSTLQWKIADEALAVKGTETGSPGGDRPGGTGAASTEDNGARGDGPLLGETPAKTGSDPRTSLPATPGQGALADRVVKIVRGFLVEDDGNRKQFPDLYKLADNIEAAIRAALQQGEGAVTDEQIETALVAIEREVGGPSPLSWNSVKTVLSKVQASAPTRIRATGEMMNAAEQEIWERSEDRDGWPVLMYREDLEAALNAALAVSGNDGEGKDVSDDRLTPALTQMERHLNFVLGHIERHYQTQAERAAIRCALGDAAHLCDALAADALKASRTHKGKGRPTKEGQTTANVARACGDAIWNLRDAIPVQPNPKRGE